MATPNPFADLDFTKLMGEFKMPGLDMESILAAQRRNIEALTQANRTAAEGLQAVARRQAEILRETMEQASAAVRDSMTQSAPEERVAKQAELAKTAFEKALSNMRELAEMVAKSNQEAASIINQRVAASLDEIKTAVSKK